MTYRYNVCIWLIIGILCSVLLWLFLPSWPISFFAALLISYWPYSAVTNLINIYRKRRARIATTLFLQHLSTHVSAGQSLVNACLSAPLSLAHIYRAREPFMLVLLDLRHDLLTHLPLRLALDRLIARMPDAQSQAILRTLTATDILGPGLRDSISAAAAMLGQISEVEREVGSENSRDQMEGIILLFMPPLVMFLLRLSGADELSRQARLPGLLLRLTAALLSLFSFWLFARADKPNSTSQNETQQSRLTRMAVNSTVIRKLSRKLLLRLPANYRLRIHRAQQLLQADVHGLDSPDASSWAGLKIVLLCFGLVMGLMLLPFGLPLWALPLIPVILSWAQDRELLQQASTYNDELMSDFPLLVGLITQLLKAGLTVSAALKFTLPQLQAGSALHREGQHLSAQLVLGRTAAQILTELANRISQPQAQAALLLLTQYEVYGGKDILQQLMHQTDTCWALQRQSTRRRQQLVHSRRLLPMILDLVAVLLIGITPALQLLL